MEALFGESGASFMRGRTQSQAALDHAANTIMARTLLPWSIFYNPSSGMWVATLQTNQKALDSNNPRSAEASLRAFSLPSEKQAIRLARAWTPPRMVPFTESPNCHVCNSKFAVFRRAAHCRNCGVCICNECAVLWPAKM
jgi:hypothetical protein